MKNKLRIPLKRMFFLVLLAQFILLPINLCFFYFIESITVSMLLTVSFLALCKMNVLDSMDVIRVYLSVGKIKFSERVFEVGCLSIRYKYLSGAGDAGFYEKTSYRELFHEHNHVFSFFERLLFGSDRLSEFVIGIVKID